MNYDMIITNGVILGADGERLSKRHGSVSVGQYRDEGFLPEALLNTLARLGWSHGDDEVFTMQQMVQWFDLGHVSHSPAKFDPEKALWMMRANSGSPEATTRAVGSPRTTSRAKVGPEMTATRG